MRKAGSPVFYDAKGARKKWLTAICGLSCAILCAAVAWLIASLLVHPVLPSWIALPDAAASRRRPRTRIRRSRVSLFAAMAVAKSWRRG